MDLFCDIYCMDTINNTSFGYKHLKKKKKIINIAVQISDCL